jgi:hypothetical protein
MSIFAKLPLAATSASFIVLSLTSVASAATITYSLTGIVNEANKVAPTFGLNVGDKISGNFSYDDTKPSIPSNFFPLTSVEIVIGTFTARGIGNTSLFNASSSTVQTSGSDYLFSFDGDWSAGVVSGLPSGLRGTYSISRVTPPTHPVPEPLTVLGSLAAGSFGVVLRSKYKHQRKTVLESSQSYTNN